MLLELRGPVKALFTHFTLVWEVLGVNRNNVPFQVTGVGALVVTVWTLVSFVALKDLCVFLELLVISKGLWAVATLVGQISAMLALDVSL